MQFTPARFAATLCLALLSLAPQAHAANFVNGLALPGSAQDLSGSASVNDGRLGYFSDLYFDSQRNEWWGLSDRGPGGGTLSYETRVQRFTLDVNLNTGAISNFNVTQTIKFNAGGVAMNGLAPSDSGTLGAAFDPEGFVINPKNGNFLVSDEYGPSLKEFDRNGNLVKSYIIPNNLTPKVGATTNYNASATTLTSGREGNRGLEGLAISPDGNFAYAMLQNGTVLDGSLNAAGTSLTRSAYTRIVKFDTSTGEAVGQYAYKLDRNGQGQGISAIVALGGDQFMVLERNNRGVGVGADLATADKSIYTIDLSGATDVTHIELPTGLNDPLPAGVVIATKGGKMIDLDANTLAALGNKSPEKWEGLAVGPRLADGTYMLLAGTDNDYSVTQNGATGTQYDVYFDFSKADPYASSIQCPLGQTTGCFTTSSSADGDGYTTTTTASLTSAHQLLPAVLHAYKSSPTELVGYMAPVPEPESLALMLAGLGVVVAMARRRA